MVYIICQLYKIIITHLKITKVIFNLDKAIFKKFGFIGRIFHTKLFHFKYIWDILNATRMF